MEQQVGVHDIRSDNAPAFQLWHHQPRVKSIGSMGQFIPKVIAQLPSHMREKRVNRTTERRQDVALAKQAPVFVKAAIYLLP